MKNYHQLIEHLNSLLKEYPAMAVDAMTNLFGFSKSQFEMKIRQLIQKMGFEKGINRMEITPNGKMMLYFANAAKARDFVITFNGMVRRISKKGNAQPAQLTTAFDKNKAAGSNALVVIDFNALKAESVDVSSDLLEMIECLHNSIGS